MSNSGAKWNIKVVQEQCVDQEGEEETHEPNPEVFPEEITQPDITEHEPQGRTAHYYYRGNKLG